MTQGLLSGWILIVFHAQPLIDLPETPAFVDLALSWLGLVWLMNIWNFVDGIDAMVGKAVHDWGRIDIVVNNAAISDDTPIEDLSDEHWHSVLAVNLDSVLNVTKTALPWLKQSRSGSIINIASVQGIRGQPHAMAYATAKGGVINLTRCMAVDFGPFGIRANAVAPGYIDTRMAEQKQGTPHEHKTDWFQDIYFKYGRMPLRRAGIAEDVAGPILFLASDDSLYVTGTVLIVDGGFTATY